MIKISYQRALLNTQIAVNIMLWLLAISVAYFVIRGFYMRPSVNELVGLCRIQSTIPYVPEEYARLQARLAELEGRQQALFALFGKDVEKRLLELGFTKKEVDVITGSGAGASGSSAGSASSSGL